MHRYRIAAQISLILSILNLVLAAPIVVQETHEARGDDAVAEDVPAMPNESDELEAASDRPTSPQHSSSSDGSTSSGYPTPHLSSFSSVSGYSWLLDRPPRLSPNRPPSLHEPASPHPSLASSGSSELPLLAWYLHALAPQRPQSHSGWRGWSPPHPSLASSGSSMSTPYASASGGSLSSHYSSALDGSVPSRDSISMPSQHSMPEGLAPSLTPDGSPPSPSSPPTETPPDSAGFFNENMIKKLKIIAGVVVIGGVIATVAGSQIKHRDCQDS